MRGSVVQPFQAVTDSRGLPVGVKALGLASSEPARPASPACNDRGEQGKLGAQLKFSTTVARYLTSVLPLVKHELTHWHAQARKIPDPRLRSYAMAGLSKRGNLEGAALFATLAPRSHRQATVRALVAFQTAYNYLDTLAEQASAEPIANGRQLHRALLVALDPAAGHPDYYLLHPQREDGGFLIALVDRCRSALATLPSHAAIAAISSRAANRIIAFQSLNLTAGQGGHEALQQWARSRAADAPDLHWWQTAAAAGSSLAVHALIAAAADPDVREQEIRAIDAAYHPRICALHSLLDSLVDVAEDEQAGQRNLLSYHESTEQAALAMKALAQGAVDATSGLPDERRHGVILSAMVGYYLSSPGAKTPYSRIVAQSVAGAVVPLLSSALVLFKARRALARIAHGGYG
jgi:tetraprenyl-beta-curcumene synthase